MAVTPGVLSPIFDSQFIQQAASQIKNTGNVVASLNEVDLDLSFQNLLADAVRDAFDPRMG